MKKMIFCLISAFFAAFFPVALQGAEQPESIVVQSENTAEAENPMQFEIPAPEISYIKPADSGKKKSGDIGALSWEGVSYALSRNMTILAVLVLFSACASKLSSWINMPCLLVFLGMGMLFGEEGFGRIEFSDPRAANILGSIAMAFILFSGGFDTHWKDIRKIAATGGILSSIGVLLTAGILGVTVYWMLEVLFPERNIPLSWCLLLGSVISSTDAAAVFSILRSKRVSLGKNLQSLLEFESGSNDPMAAFLTVFMVGIVLSDMKSGGPVCGFDAYKMIVPYFIQKMLLGVVLGMTWGFIMVWLFNKIQLEYDGLYYVLGTAAVLLSYGATEMLHGNGFMSVYVTGIVMGNRKFIYHNGIGRFSEGVAWLMQVLLFCILGLLVTPSNLWKNWDSGLTIALILMVVARPAAVFLSMIGSPFSTREKMLVSWVGLRGGAPIMLATFPLMAKVPYCDLMFHVVFFIVITSVLIQGMTIMPMARLLHLDHPLAVHPRVPLEFDNTGTLDGETREFEILKGSALIGKTLSMAGIPRGALVLLIRRGGRFVIPHGSTVIQENDGLLVLAEVPILDETAAALH